MKQIGPKEAALRAAREEQFKRLQDGETRASKPRTKKTAKKKPRRK